MIRKSVKLRTDPENNAETPVGWHALKDASNGWSEGVVMPDR